MSVSLFISLEKEEEPFYPGQIVQGKVKLVNESAVKIKGLTVTFFGDAEVYWTEAEIRRDTVSPHRNRNGINPNSQHSQANRHVHKEFRNQETILCHEIVLLGQGETEGGIEFMLNPGSKEYMFQYQLPPAGLPSTFKDSPFGSILYSVEARLNRPMFRYDKAEKEFVVKGVLDINSIPRILQPYGTEERVDFGWICCPDGHLNLDVRLPKTGYSPNETIYFTVSIRNSSRVLADQISATLTQDIEFNTFDRSKNVSSELQYISYQSLVEPYGVATWNASFNLPNYLRPSTLAGCRIINFQYSIKVIVNASDKTCTAVCPIFIGTDPYEIQAITQANSAALSHSENVYSNSSWIDVSNEPIERNAARNEYDPSLNPFLNGDSDDDDSLNNISKEIKISNNLDNLIDVSQD